MPPSAASEPRGSEGERSEAIPYCHKSSIQYVGAQRDNPSSKPVIPSAVPFASSALIRRIRNIRVLLFWLASRNLLFHSSLTMIH